MSLQDITGFKPGTAFTALIHAYGNIRMGIDAYGQLVAKNLNDVLNTIDEALDMDLARSTVSGAVMVPLYNDDNGTIRITTITKSDLARCLQNDGPDFNVGVNAVIDNNPYTLELSSSEVVSAFSRYVDQCAGMKSLVSQIVNSDFNLTFSQLYPNTIKGGSEVSEWLSDLIETTSGSTNVLKVFSYLLSADTETNETASDYVFNADYSSSSSVVVGLNAISEDVTTFFDSLDFSIWKLGDSIKQMGIKIFDALKYLLSSAFVELDQHFVLNDKAKFETCDVPIIYSSFPAQKLVSAFPQTFSAQRYHFNDGSGYVDVVVDTSRTEQQIAEECIISVLQSIRNNGNLVIPVAGNFVLLSLPQGYNVKDPLLSVVYCGIYPIGIKVPFLNHQYIASIADNIIVPQSEGPMYPLMESKSQSNEDVVDFIAKSISHDDSISLPDVPFGINLETPNLFGSGVPLSINFNNPTKGGDLLADYENSGGGANMSKAVKFASYAVIYYCIASDMVSQVNLKASIYNSANEFIKFIPIDNPGFLPYCHTDSFECYVHAQTDAERSDEVKALIMKVLIAAAAVAGTTFAAKTRKKLKLKAKSKRAMANRAEWDLQNDPGNLFLADAALKATKAANRAEILSNVLNPIGMASKILSSFVSPKPNANQENRDNHISNLLTNLERKYNDDDTVQKIRDLNKLISG